MSEQQDQQPHAGETAPEQHQQVVVVGPDGEPVGTVPAAGLDLVGAIV